MAKSANNLKAVLQDTADAIRSKTGGSADLCPRDFADEIATIQTGGGEPSGIVLAFPNKPNEYSGSPKAAKTEANQSFGRLYVLANPSGGEPYYIDNNTRFGVKFCKSGDTSKVLKLIVGSQDSDGNVLVELKLEDGTTLFSFYQKKGTYWSIPYWFNGGDSLTIMEFDNGIWYDSTNRWVRVTSNY